MRSSNRGMHKFLSIGLVVLMLWFGLLTSAGVGLGPSGGTTQAKANFGPALDLFPSWVISPTTPVLATSPLPPADLTIGEYPVVPGDTLYVKVGSVVRDAQSGVFRMYYEASRIVTSTVSGLQVTRSGISLAVSPDGVSWSKPTGGQPIFAPEPGSWDSAYVGSPRVIFDGTRYRMFYVGSNDVGNFRFSNNGPASLGVAESVDGLNWTRPRTTPLLTPTALAWDSLYVEPSSVKIESGILKLYYTGSNTVGEYESGLATIPNFINTATADLSLIKDGSNPINVNGSPSRVKSVHTLRQSGSLIMWYVSNQSGSDLIYQAVGSNEVTFTRDPNNSIIKPTTGVDNDLVSQIDIGDVQTQVISGTQRGVIYFTGLSGSNLGENVFRAISIPTPPPATPAPIITPILLPTSSAPQPTPTAGQPALPAPVPNAGPGAFFTPTPGEGSYPSFLNVWRRTDEPVRAGFAQRSWIYGGIPTGFRYLREPYEDGSRLVQYHDKARLEESGNGGVSSGLLVKELISGQMQIGDNKFEPRNPANEAIAGDAIEVNPNNPAYYSLFNVASLSNDKRIDNRSSGGVAVIESLNRAGEIGFDGNLGNFGVTYAYYENILGHNIANVFYDFLAQRGVVIGPNGYTTDTVFDWISVVGLPLTEPYWTKATVGGEVKDVLVQAFERRVLTYTPTNADPFKVEMGNVGRHYFRWRYNLNS